MLKYAAALAVSSVALAGAAQAEVVTFSGVVGDTTKPGGYTEDGVTVSNAANRFWGYDGAGTLHLDRGSTNGTYSFTYAGGVFDLLSFSLLGNSAGSTATLTAFDAAGQQIKTGNFTLSGSSQTFADWTGLSRVQLTATGNHFSIDNFTIAAATAAVPEPATWAMMLMGFGGMGFAMRRKRSVGARIRFA